LKKYRAISLALALGLTLTTAPALAKTPKPTLAEIDAAKKVEAAKKKAADAQAAKMAGTPQQMRAALQQSAETPTLGTALRRKQYGRALTEQEAAGMQKSADMQKLGGLGDRVDTMIKSEFKKPAGAEVDLNTELDVIKKDPNSQEAMDAMLRLVQSGQKLDDIAKLIPEAATAIGDVAKKAIRDPKDIKATEFLPDLGYDATSLAGLLGVTPEEIQGYSLTDLQNKVNQVTSQEFTQAEQLGQQAVSPFAGVAERGLAREAARELSTTGVRATEADMQRLNDSVAKADQVTMFGETRSVGDWLADDEISALIKQVVESPADSDLRKQMQQEAPELYKFVEDNEAALKTAAANLDISATKLGGIKPTNKDTYTRAGLSDEAAKIFAPSLTQPQSKALTADDVPVIGYLNSLSDTERKTVSDVLNKLQATDPTLAAEVAKLSKDEFISLGIGKSGSNWEKMIKHNLDVNEIENIPEDDTDALLTKAYSDAPPAETAQQYIGQGNTLSGLGLESGVAVTSLDPTTLKQSILDSKGKKVSIQDAVSGNIPDSKKQSFGSPKEPDPESANFRIYKALTPIMSDGNLSAEEINDPKGPVSKLSWDDLLVLEDLSKNPKASIDKTALAAVLNKKKNENTSNVLLTEALLPAGSDLSKIAGTYASILQYSDPRKINMDTVKNRMYDATLSELKNPSRLNSNYKSIDQTIDLLKKHNLLTPEMITEINKTAKHRAAVQLNYGAGYITDEDAKQRKLDTNKRMWEATKYPYKYGIDEKGNPLPAFPITKTQTSTSSKTTKKK